MQANPDLENVGSRSQSEPYIFFIIGIIEKVFSIIRVRAFIITLKN